MGLVDIIESSSDSATKKEVSDAVMEYAADKTPQGIRKELAQRGKPRRMLSRKIKIFSLEFLLFQLATGIGAAEQIRFNSNGKTPGYNSLRNLAYTLSGKPKKTATQAGKYFRRLAEENHMPLLTKEHRRYIARFDAGYVRRTDSKKLRKEIPLGRGVSINPRSNIYSPFLHEISRKLRRDRELKREFYRKMKDSSPISLAHILTGKRMNDYKSREYLRKLAA